MKKLEQGEYYGKQKTQNLYNNVIVTDTIYTHNKVEWHHHENPYFTYLLQGKLFEANKNESYYLKPGNLMFHNWQDAHHNEKTPELTRGFHLELNKKWFNDYDVELKEIEGSILIQDPIIKHYMNQIFLESKLNDHYTSLALDSILLELFRCLKGKHKKETQRPQWADRLQQILLSDTEDMSLSTLATELNIHPVYLSREFSRFFGTTLGNYIRRIKLNKAFHLVLSSRKSLIEISYLCGFYDQSHFTRSFKSFYGLTPSKAQRRFNRG